MRGGRLQRKGNADGTNGEGRKLKTWATRRTDQRLGEPAAVAKHDRLADAGSVKRWGGSRAPHESREADKWKQRQRRGPAVGIVSQMRAGRHARRSRQSVTRGGGRRVNTSLWDDTPHAMRRRKNAGHSIRPSSAGSWDSQPRGKTPRLRQRHRPSGRGGVHRRLHRHGEIVLLYSAWRCPPSTSATPASASPPRSITI